MAPAAQPDGGVRCHWGACQAGGWILAGSWRLLDEYGAAFHHGGLAAMEFSVREQRGAIERCLDAAAAQRGGCAGASGHGVCDLRCALRHPTTKP